MPSHTIKTIMSLLTDSYLFQFIEVFANLLLLGFPLKAFLLRGVVKGSDSIANVLYLGNEAAAHNFARLVYSRTEEMQCLGSYFPFQINPSRFGHADIVVVRASEKLLKKLVKGGFFLLPSVRFGLDLRVPMSKIIARTEHGLKNAIRRIENLDYSYSIHRNDKQALETFYWNMYLPYAKERFGKAAITISYQKMKSFYERNGGILMIKRNGQLVWGDLFQISGQTIHDRYLGTNAKTIPWEARLESHITYFFVIQWAKSQNIMEYDGGIAQPFLSDGIFRYKKGWGMFVRKLRYAPSWALRINSPSEGSLSLLERNPFIFMDQGKLKSLAFIRTHPKNTEPEHLASQFCIPNLDSSLVITCQQSGHSSAKSKENSRTRVKSGTTLSKPLSYLCSLLLRQEINFSVSERTLS